MKKNSTPAVWKDHFALLYFARILLSSTAAVHVASAGRELEVYYKFRFAVFVDVAFGEEEEEEEALRMFTGISFLFTLDYGDNEPDYDTGRARKECASELGLID
ncbi:hypothetical protein T06_13799 [Trichinella sp. T6]|nr:hypothetical protein T06_13799 [Trichinella sp. T6]